MGLNKPTVRKMLEEVSRTKGSESVKKADELLRYVEQNRNTPHIDRVRKTDGGGGKGEFRSVRKG